MVESNHSYAIVESMVFSSGCKYVFGSWTWRNGWDWDTKEDALPIADIQSYGLTTAINASTSLFSKCEITSIDKYGIQGVWYTLDPVFFEEANVIFFKMQRMWHFVWVGIHIPIRCCIIIM